MAEESRIRAARRVRGILLGFPPEDRKLIVQLASAEGAKSAAPAEAPKRRGRKPGPKPKGNGHAKVEAAAPAPGFKKDGTPKKKPGPRKKVEDTPTEAETNAAVDAELERGQEGEQPAGE